MFPWEIYVALKGGTEVPGLIGAVEQLAIIHRADEADWPALVAAMLKGKWSVHPRRDRVDVVQSWHRIARAARPRL
jgi:hypothetical protein